MSGFTLARWAFHIKMHCAACVRNRWPAAGEQKLLIGTLQRQNLRKVPPEYNYLDVQTTPGIVQKVFSNRVVTGGFGDFEDSDMISDIPELLVFMKTSLPTNYRTQILK